MPITPRRQLASAQAFTLIELLVVVAIIALLISILLPSLNSAREQSRAVKCMANLRTMGQGIVLYANNERGMLPGPLHPPVFRDTGRTADYDGSNASQFDPMDPNTGRPWFLLSRLAPMLSDNENELALTDKVATCDTARMLVKDQDFLPGKVINGGTNAQFMHPFNYIVNTWSTTSPTKFFGWVNYGATWKTWNEQYLSDLSASGPEKANFQAPKQIDGIRRPADNWAVGDAWVGKPETQFISPTNIKKFPTGTWQLPPENDVTMVMSANSSANPIPRSPYHANKKATNCVFMDGHAARVVGKWNDVFPPRPNYPP